MPRPEDPGSQGAEHSQAGMHGQGATAHDRTAARKAYKDEWEAANPGQEFPGFPPELEGMGKGGEDDAVEPPTDV